MSSTGISFTFCIVGKAYTISNLDIDDCEFIEHQIDAIQEGWA